MWNVPTIQIRVPYVSWTFIWMGYLFLIITLLKIIYETQVLGRIGIQVILDPFWPEKIKEDDDNEGYGMTDVDGWETGSERRWMMITGVSFRDLKENNIIKGPVFLLLRVMNG